MIKQTKEEIANSSTHFFGVFITLILAFVLLSKGADLSFESKISIMVFCIFSGLMYFSSGIYHLALPGKGKRVLRYFDHINIYLLIAASYTPILVCALDDKTGKVMLCVIWGLAVVGILYKIFFLGKYPKVSLTIYLLMGWSIMAIAKTIWNALPGEAVFFLVIEGILYSLGTFFYSKDTQYPYFHSIWHLFVIGGNLSHAAAVWFIL
ncbi:MAG: hemolysin III family protein [Bacteroidales bacterium]|nr:hemolysin III family protein [Bacteroidales bacterium]